MAHQKDLNNRTITEKKTTGFNIFLMQTYTLMLGSAGFCVHVNGTAKHKNPRPEPWFVPRAEFKAFKSTKIISMRDMYGRGVLMVGC